MTIGDRIKLIRESKGLNQRDFSSEIKIGQSTLAMFENGQREPKAIHIEQICSKFGVNEHWLRTGEGSPDSMDSQELRFAKNIAKLQRTDNETIINWVNAIAETNPEMLVEIEKFFKSLLGIK